MFSADTQAAERAWREASATLTLLLSQNLSAMLNGVTPPVPTADIAKAREAKQKTFEALMVHNEKGRGAL